MRNPAFRRALCALVIAAASASCRELSGWEPAGKVAFIELRESTDLQGTKKGSLDYSIRNTGRSKIEGTTFSFTFATDARRYHFTVVDENALQPGALAYGRVVVDYCDAAEAGSLEGASVDSTQFR
jgi:hypothetical protein